MNKYLPQPVIEYMKQGFDKAREQWVQDGCKGCAFSGMEEWQDPCRMCCRKCKDYWRPKVVEIRGQ